MNALLRFLKRIVLMALNLSLSRLSLGGNGGGEAGGGGSPVNPAVSTDTYTPPAAGAAASFNVQGTYAGADTVDAYFALGDSMTVTEAQLKAKSGGTGVDAFFSVAGVTVTGGNFNFDEAIEPADLTVVTSLADASAAAQLKYVIVERNNGGTTGVLTAGDTITSGDYVVPTLSSAVIELADPDTVVLTFSEALYGSTSTSDWTLTGNTISAVSFTPTGTTVSLTLGTTATSGDDYTGDLSYSGTGLRDVAGNDVATFTGEDVTNNIPAYTNYFTNSEDLASWTIGTNNTITSDADTPGPVDLSGRAADEQESDSSNSNECFITTTTLASGTYNISMYGKANDASWNRIRINDGAAQVWINFSTGATSTATGFASTPSVSGPDANGYYRWNADFTLASSGTIKYGSIISDGGGSAFEAINQGIFLTGGQITSGSGVKAYVGPT